MSFFVKDTTQQPEKPLTNRQQLVANALFDNNTSPQHEITLTNRPHLAVDLILPKQWR
jgi:hypothetical protein